MKVSKIPLVTATLHFLLFLITALYVFDSSDNQAALVWLLWTAPDFPISLLMYFAPTFSSYVHAFVSRDSVADYLLYPPHLVYGLLGTVWWYAMPRAIVIAAARWRRRGH